uniref:Metalloendopeptidase n=1 Tax=Parastrongyloides trichosuri TaxID=131310 RepID=A0A0N4ZJ49_PARTI
MYLFSIIIFLLLNIFNTQSIEDDIGNTRYKRGIMKRGMKLKWTFPIKYYAEKEVNETNVDNALIKIMNNTCVLFQKVDKHNKTIGLRYFKGNGCWSSTGRVKYNRVQDISLGNNCDMLYGAIQHATAHSLGLYHENTRYDAGGYLRIKTGNIEKGKENKFKKFLKNQSYVYDTQFDYGSLMLNSIYSFSKNGCQVVFPIKSDIYNSLIGQRYSLSFNDYKVINKFYCDSKCNKDEKLECQNGGYQNPLNCTTCKCPIGYKGKLCDEIEKSNNKKCGNSYIKLTNHTPVIIKAKQKMKCNYLVTAKSGDKIKVKVVKVNTTLLPMCFHSLGLEIKYQSDKGATGACFCGNYTNYIFISENHEVFIQYVGRSIKHYFEIRLERIQNLKERQAIISKEQLSDKYIYDEKK